LLALPPIVAVVGCCWSPSRQLVSQFQGFETAHKPRTSIGPESLFLLVSGFRWIPESPSQNLCLVTVLGGDLWDNEGMPSRPRRPVAKEPTPAPASHAVLGYARVSTGHQLLDQQLDALAAAGVSGRVFTDTMSGTRDDRPGLAELMAYARAGDTVTVVALDRLGRSLSGIVQTVKTLGERRIVLRSLREGVDTSTSTGRMVLGIFASLADYERTLIGERAAAAREAARIRGRQVGRPSALTTEQVAMTVRMRAAGSRSAISAAPSASGGRRCTAFGRAPVGCRM